MATIAAMATLHAKCLSHSSLSHRHSPNSANIKPISFLSLHNLPRGLLTASKPPEVSNPSSLTATAIAGAIFSALSSSDTAFAAQQVADIAEGDNRGLALLIPLVPAIAWVLFNILQPALNQINRMRSEKSFVVGLGLGLGSGLAGAGFMLAPAASASEITELADAASSSDNRGLLLLFVVAPAIAWVLFNILQPALNQINRMRSG